MVCGTFGTHSLHLHYVDQVLGRKPNASCYAAMNILMLPNRTVAIVDTHVNENPSAEQIAEITIAAGSGDAQAWPRAPCGAHFSQQLWQLSVPLGAEDASGARLAP